MPARVQPSQTLLRLRPLGEYRLVSAKADTRELNVQGETIDLSGMTGRVVVVA